MASSGMGRARLRDSLPALSQATQWNAYCIYCAHWHFGQQYEKCPRCHGFIFRWVPTEDLRFFCCASTLGRL